MTMEESTKFIDFKTPEAWVFVLGHGHILKMRYVISSSSLHWDIVQKFSIKEVSSKIVNLMTPRVRVLLLGHGRMSL